MLNDYPPFVAERFVKRAEDGEGLVHASIGMVGELIELRGAHSPDNLLEELGDFEFYFCAFHQVLGFQWIFNNGGERAALGLVLAQEYLLDSAEFLLDQSKKVWVYGKEINKVHLEFGIANVQKNLNQVYHVLGVNRALVISGNMDKLRKRYPVGYTDALAIERRDKA